MRLDGSGILPDGNPQASLERLTFLVLTPPKAMSVYFRHLSQSLTGEVVPHTTKGVLRAPGGT